MDKQLEVRIKRSLKSIKGVTATVKVKIFKDLDKDLILPILKLRKNCNISWAISKKYGDIFLQIGPRDWQWNRKTGAMIGSGTCLG